TPQPFLCRRADPSPTKYEREIHRQTEFFNKLLEKLFVWMFGTDTNTRKSTMQGILSAIGFLVALRRYSIATQKVPE
ncbi:MAG: hypothetical protein ACYC92_08985, partial [Candidatus Acidiferrales bacterium]